MEGRLSNIWLYNILDFLHGTKVRTRTTEEMKSEKRARDMQFEKELHVGTDLEDGEERTQAKESGKLLEAGKAKNKFSTTTSRKKCRSSANFI